MTNRIVSLSDVAADDEGTITGARRRISAEIEAATGVERSLRKFKQAITDLEPRVTQSDGVHSRKIQSISDSQTVSKECLRVMDAFENEMGDVVSSSLDTRRDTVNAIAGEFSPDLARSLVTALNADCFPPTLKAGLIQESSNKAERYRSAIQALKTELDSVTETDSAIKDVTKELDTIGKTVSNSTSYDELAEVYSGIESHERRLNEVAADRQQLIRSRSGCNRFTIDHDKLREELYGSWAIEYPCLHEITETAQACTDAKARITKELRKFS